MKLRPILPAIAACAALCAQGMNPYLPLWEYIPDGEPYVFADPDNPGKKRVYIYGSHDSLENQYCGREQVVWSAPVDSLDRWRYDGVILEVKYNALGDTLNAGALGDVLYAPDVAVVETPQGPVYYLYPNDQHGGRNGLVARSNRPDGPFEVINWNPEKPMETIGVLGFDPAVFVDDDGRVYGYWGFGTSNAAEMDPTTMATVKPGTEIVTPMISGRTEDDVFHFFEASSIRKIQDKYVFVYSREAPKGEWGFPDVCNYTLAYAYSDSPLGPYTYGGTLIDGRGRHTLVDGRIIATAHPGGNTHGSICEIDGQWWVFYHRQCGLDEYSRQAMVAPIEVKVTPGKGGKVEIAEAELTSEGFEISGLDLRREYPAGIASHYTGPRPARHSWPIKVFNGPYPYPGRYHAAPEAAPEELNFTINPVINCTDGSILGYKYFNFDLIDSDGSIEMAFVPKGLGGRIDVVVGDPYATTPHVIGSLAVTPGAPERLTRQRIPLEGLKDIKGKQPLYFFFHVDTPEQSMADIYTIGKFMAD